MTLVVAIVILAIFSTLAFTGLYFNLQRTPGAHFEWELKSPEIFCGDRALIQHHGVMCQ